MRRAYGQTISGCRGLLEGRSEGRRRLKLMDANPDIPQRRRRRSFARRQGRCHEAFGEHGGEVNEELVELQWLIGLQVAWGDFFW